MNKRILTLLSLSLFTASLFSQVNWKALYYVDYLDTLDGLVYTPRTDKPYTGKVLDLYANGNKMMEGMLWGSRRHGKWTFFKENGQKEFQITYDKGHVLSAHPVR